MLVCIRLSPVWQQPEVDPDRYTCPAKLGACSGSTTQLATRPIGCDWHSQFAGLQSTDVDFTL